MLLRPKEYNKTAATFKARCVFWLVTSSMPVARVNQDPLRPIGARKPSLFYNKQTSGSRQGCKMIDPDCWIMETIARR
ncbi:MAG: hypothetical protein AAF471_04835 [Myxococcota bacterium]